METDDFREASRQNPEFLAAARREILTQELIELPEKFTKFRDETSGRFDKMEPEFGVIKGMTFGHKSDKALLSSIVTDFGLRRIRIVTLAEYNRVSQEFSEAV